MLRGLVLPTLSTLTVLAALACGPTAMPGAEGTGADAGGSEIRIPPGSGAFDCQDIPEEGECRGDVAILCDRRSSSIVERRCGARGLTCEVTAEGAVCVNEDGEEEDVPADDPEPGTGEPATACGDVTFEGECSGNTLRYCKPDGTLKVLECNTIAGACGLHTIHNWYACLPTNCGDVTMGDKCEGNVLKQCSYDASGPSWSITTEDCSQYSGETCMVDAEGEGWCDAGNTGGGTGGTGGTTYTCEQLGVEGVCINATTYQYCVSTIQTFDCSQIGQVCGVEGGLAVCVDQ